MALNRRDFIKTVAGGLVAISTGEALSAPEDRRKPNILYIMTDQQPVSTLGCYGNSVVQTPHLDKLAATGVLFENFYISGFPCSPSRASIFSGLYPCHHGVEQNDVLYDPKLLTLAQVLKPAGYDTSYAGKWHLGGHMYRGTALKDNPNDHWYWSRKPSEDGFRFEKAEGGQGEDAPQHGFETWAGGWRDYHRYLREAGRADLLKKFPRVGNHNDAPCAPEGQHMYSQLPEELHMAAFFARETANFIRGRKDSGRPWCAAMSFYGPHLPVAPPRPWDEMYSLDQVELPANHRDPLENKPFRQRNNRRCRKLGQWTDEQFKDYIRRYWGYCSYIDRQIGKVFQALEETGQRDNTVVMFTADHGDMIGAHGFIWKMGYCGYQELFNVPLLVRAPGVTKAGQRTAALASNIDLFPTLLDLCGIEPPPNLDGRSMRKVLDGSQDSFRDAVFCEWTNSTIAMREGKWKFCLHWAHRDIDELYDLEADPGEMTNLAMDPAYKAQAERMRQRAIEWARDTGHEYSQVIAQQAAKDPLADLVLVEPKVESFKYLGGNEFEMTILWIVEGPVPKDTKYWSFTQFCNKKYGKDGSIVFRFTPYPDPPTKAWKKGDRVKVGPVKVKVPAHAGPGKYEVRVGLYSPEKKKGPGILKGSLSNALVLGTLTIQRKNGQVTGISYKDR